MDRGLYRTLTFQPTEQELAEDITGTYGTDKTFNGGAKFTLPDNEILDVADLRDLMKITGRGGMSLEIDNLLFDMNNTNQGTPDPDTAFQQASCVNIKSDGTPGISRIDVSDIVIIRPVGDGLTFGGSNEQTETFGDIYVNNVEESGRLYSRSTVTFVAPFNYAEVRDCPSIDSIEVELNYHIEGMQNTMHVENVTVARQLDINFKNL